jgi:hypothetical protein
MRTALILSGLLCFSTVCTSQIISTSNSQLVTGADSEIAIKTTGNVSIAQDISNAKIYLELFGASQTISETLTVRKLILSGIGDKTIDKNLNITEGIDFRLGTLKPSVSSKLVYSGSFDGITGGNDNSYVDGFFFNQTDGARLFPVGASGLGYAPATILTGNSQREIGMRLVNQSANFVAAADSEVKKLENTHYWEVSASNVADIASRVTLSLKGVDETFADNDGLSLAVVQADNTGEVVDGLGSSVYDNSTVTSENVFTKSLLGIGASEKIVVSVIDIITPRVDQHNDFLKIINIEKFDVRKVKLLDRYGFSIKEWNDFTNYDDLNTPNQDGFDFNKLTSGNYICVVEYGNAGSGTQSIQQMVSVIKN